MPTRTKILMIACLAISAVLGVITAVAAVR
jgi:hypothetical protein